MIDHAIGIVAHVDRIDMAHELSESVGARVVNPDDGTLGPLGNHTFMHNRLAMEHGWSVILEDDAIPLNSFADDLDWVLTHAKEPIVSLYLGTGFPGNWQPRIEQALVTDPCWVKCDRLLHAVGYAVAPELKGHVAQWMGKCLRTRVPIAPEDAISTWAHRLKIPVLYTNPSLVDHRDGPTVVTPRQRGNFRGSGRPRHAHNTRQRLTWNDSTVTMDSYGNR